MTFISEGWGKCISDKFQTKNVCYQKAFYVEMMWRKLRIFEGENSSRDARTEGVNWPYVAPLTCQCVVHHSVKIVTLQNVRRKWPNSRR